MGDYNPHAPYILGHEWVPIRNAPYQQDHVTERGYTFRLEHAVTPVSGAYYIAQNPENFIAQACDFIAIYPAGTEDRTGPIKKLHIPASAVSLSPNPPFVIDITEGAAALQNATDNKSIGFGPNAEGESDSLWINFDTASYAAQLIGKRILDVRIRYAFVSFDPTEAASHITVGVRQTGLLPFPDDISFTEATVVTDITSPAVISSFSLSDLNPFWNAAIAVNLQRDIFPWRWAELDRFHASYSPSTSQLAVAMAWTSSLTSAALTYCDLEVTYCEESRVLYGGRRTQNINDSTASSDFYNPGPQVVRLRDPNFNVGAALTPGDYTVVISHRDFAINSIYQGSPLIYATRQYYELPPLRGVQVHQSTVENSTFTVDDDSVITHLTLHTASSIVTGVHAYGTSVGAPVFGACTATQEIEDNPSGGAGVPYPQVRFYARRFADTTVPLTLVDVATGTSTVSINVADFDALDEIVDGWKEVTLRFATAPTFPVTADDVDWRWQATGEVAGNQWQVLASSGPSVASPTPFSSALATGPATYWAPNGSNVTLTWQSPSISGSASDTTSDAVLIFSQDPPAVTGFAITQLTQAVTGTGSGAFAECGINAKCVPVGIRYNRLAWNALGVCDTFSVAQTDGWPNADSGQVWTNSGGAVPDNYDVGGGLGQHTHTTINTARNSAATVAAGVSVTDVTVDVGVSQLATGDTIFAGPSIGPDSTNIYHARLQFRTDGNVYFEVIKRVPGQTTLFTALNIGTYAPNVMWSIRLMYLNGTVYARAWPQSQPQPTVWIAAVADASLTSFTTVVLRSQTGATSTNVNPIVYWDNLSAVYAPILDGSIEIQRRDSVTTDWQTIMSSVGPACVGQFNDFEARVGLASDYRIRTLNVLDFAGPWVSGSGTIPSPGVVMANSGTANSVLMFTSNEQSASNLAYVMQWEGAPVEEFLFPEADSVQLQHMFGRDFAISFHPLERGGERFNRVILVNAAAIAVPSLGNFRGLRDLAWADLSYVCVRDELGNRWFAAVIVPQGEVRSNRTVYLARITVSEATGTASPVDPVS